MVTNPEDSRCNTSGSIPPFSSNEKVYSSYCGNEAMRLIQSADELVGWFDDNDSLVVENGHGEILFVLAVDSAIMNEIMLTMSN